MADKMEIKSISEKICKNPASDVEYKAEKGRYHLYTCHGCPFAHRVTAYISLKGLEDVISIDTVDPVLNRETGWVFSPEKRGCTPDRVNNKKYLKEIYEMSHPNYTGRITVPVLFDKKTAKIVSNESADIIRILNHEFDEFCSTKQMADLDLYPEDKAKEIDAANQMLNREIYRSYKVGGNVCQEEYEKEVTGLFHGLDQIEERLSKQRYLVGNSLTEADICFFVFLIRFDIAYAWSFKCMLKKIVDYKNLWGYLRDIYQHPRMRSTVNFDHIKQLYYMNKTRNPSGIIPLGPNLNYDEYSGRDVMFT